VRAPAYGTASLADLLPSVLASLGVPGERAPLALPETARAVVLLVDGLGLRLLEQHAELAPFLNALFRRELTAGFPATTVTSLSSFGTGLPPGEHGLTGYTSWVEEVGASVGWLGWAAAGRDLREQLVPEQVQPRATALQRAEAAGIGVTVAAPAQFDGSGLTRAVLRGGRYQGAVTPGDAVAHAAASSREGKRSLVYCYTPDLDLIGHVRGVDSDAWRAQLRLVDTYVEQLAAALPGDAVLHVTADHGMVDVAPDDRVDLDTEPGLLLDVDVVAGEPRARHLHVRPGAAGDVRDRWQQRLGGRAHVLLREQVVAAGLLGPTATPEALRRTGDVVAVATDRVALVRTQAEPMVSGLVGQHGALTDQELLVPLLTTP
jgi:hypothetical protein